MRRETTHWGAPFGGRHKELALLLHLMQEGLAGRLAHVYVRGEPGVGRRRLLREAFRRGPWAEWIDLSPGCTAVDLKRWSHDELVDFLEAYPKVGVPSWSLAVFSRFNPRLKRYARQPLLSPAGIDLTPATVAEALAGLAYSLAVYAPIVVHAAAEPEPGSWEAEVLAALSRLLENPGVVLVSGGASLNGQVDPPHQRSLALEPHSLEGVLELTRQWFGEGEGRDVAPWLHRASGGNAFAMSEIMRWLEESGCVRIDETTGTVTSLTGVRRFPVPLNVHAIMHTRWERLTPEARYVFHQIVHHDGRLTQEQLQARYPGRDGDQGFNEALSLLRRRSFLYRSTYRHPLAPSSPLWTKISEEPSKRKFKRAKERTQGNGAGHPPAAPPVLSQALHTVEQLRQRLAQGESPHTLVPDLLPVLRLRSRRRGAAWDALWGRTAYLMAAIYERKQNHDMAATWARRGRRRLDPEVFPGLRRSLGLAEARIWENRGDTETAARLRRELKAEALWAGHLAAARALVPDTAMELDRTPVRLVLLGGRGISSSKGLKPLPLFPEWWQALLALCVSRGLLGEHPVAEELEAAYRAVESRPWQLEEAALDFNRLLFLEHSGGGGLTTGPHGLRWSFTDLWCDAREVMALPEDATAFSRAGVLTAGLYLPGFHHPTVERARRALRRKLIRIAEAHTDTLQAADYHAWVEGAGHFEEVRALLATKVKQAGKIQLAQALGAAFPSAEV